MTGIPDRTTITRVIVNARIRTDDPHRPWVDAVALAGERVVRAASSAEIRKLAPGVPVEDGHGAVLRIAAGRLIESAER